MFDPQAIAAVYRYAQGLPRVINTICDNALLGAYSANLKTIDDSFVESVIEQMTAIAIPGNEAAGAAASASSTGLTRC